MRGAATAAAAETARADDARRKPPQTRRLGWRPTPTLGASSGLAEVQVVVAACGMQEEDRVPLSEMVLDCTRRWFQDALKGARAGDAAMQVLVGQMYRTGYGVSKNEHMIIGDNRGRTGIHSDVGEIFDKESNQPGGPEGVNIYFTNGCVATTMQQ